MRRSAFERAIAACVAVRRKPARSHGHRPSVRLQRVIDLDDYYPVDHSDDSCDGSSILRVASRKGCVGCGSRAGNDDLSLGRILAVPRSRRGGEVGRIGLASGDRDGCPHHRV